MLIYAVTTALTFLLSLQDAPADREKQIVAHLSARAQELCETRPRPANETLEACTQRRITALLATHGTPAAALTSVGGPSGAAGGGSLGFPTLTESVAAASVESTVPAPAPAAEAPVRCRQETTRSQDGTSVSTSLVCGNGDASEQQVRDMLDGMFPDND
jgi:hypothetical protein